MGWPLSTSSGKEPACQCRRCKRSGFGPWSGRSSGEGNGNPLQHSCLGNCTCRGAWLAVQTVGLKVGHNLANDQEPQVYRPHHSPLIVVFWPRWPLHSSTFSSLPTFSCSKSWKSILRLLISSCAPLDFGDCVRDLWSNYTLGCCISSLQRLCPRSRWFSMQLCVTVIAVQVKEELGVQFKCGWENRNLANASKFLQVDSKFCWLFFFFFWATIVITSAISNEGPQFPRLNVKN